MKPKITDMRIESVIIKGRLNNNEQIELIMNKKEFFKWRDKLKDE